MQGSESGGLWPPSKVQAGGPGLAITMLKSHYCRCIHKLCSQHKNVSVWEICQHLWRSANYSLQSCFTVSVKLRTYIIIFSSHKRACDSDACHLCQFNLLIITAIYFVSLSHAKRDCWHHEDLHQWNCTILAAVWLCGTGIMMITLYLLDLPCYLCRRSNNSQG